MKDQSNAYGNITFMARPLDPTNWNSWQQAFQIGTDPASSQGVQDMQSFVSGVLNDPETLSDLNNGDAHIVNAGWSLGGTYAIVAAETEFAKFNLAPTEVQTITFGSAPQTPTIAYLESNSSTAPDQRSWAVINGFLNATTQNYVFENDPVYNNVDLNLAAYGENMTGNSLPPLTIPGNAAVWGYNLNASWWNQSNAPNGPDLLFGYTNSLGDWPSLIPYSGALSRVPTSHMIENYTVSVPGNNFSPPPIGFLRQPTAVPPERMPIPI